MKKWEVFKDGKSLGLKTAGEIRQSLREGAIDPFDMVCEEGSTIKSELVEVDEIFNEDADSDSGEASSQEVSPPDLPSRIINLDQATGTGHRPAPQAPPPRQFPDPAPLDQNSKMTASAMNRAIKAESQIANQSSSNTNDKKKAKKFELIDEKKRVLGPVSAVEIQSLFQRGIISTSVKVRKVDGTKLIPVRQFISNYSDKRIKALSDKASASKTGNPSSKVLNELYQNMNSKKMAQKKPPLGIFVLVGIVVLGVAFLFLSQDPDSSDKGKKRVIKKAEAPTEVQAPPVPVKKPEPVREPVVKKSAPPPVPKSSPPPEVKQEPPPKVVTKPKPKPAPPRPKARKPIATPKPRPAPVSRPKAKVEAVPPKLPSSTSRPANPQPAANTKGPIARALENVGSVATIGPLKYRNKDLENCALKCRLRFRDSAGGALEAVFFKGAYYDILKANSGGVTITGSTKIEGGGLVVFIQDVR
ncbi:MAG: hypothetical protein HRU19_13985 [Pseudobacteriovorax sp.]|nr:hypothetical protein [Pseudobacteriovorax sp.]